MYVDVAYIHLRGLRIFFVCFSTDFFINFQDFGVVNTLLNNSTLLCLLGFSLILSYCF